MAPELTIWMWGLAFVGGHLLFSHPPVRTPLRDRLGPRGFFALYAALATVGLVGLVQSWWTARHSGALLWNLRGGPLPHIIQLFIVLAFALIFAGAIKMTPSGFLLRGKPIPGEVTGAAAVTRHPVGLGIALLALCHMLMNGWVGDLGFWGAFFLLGTLGTLHQDARLSAERPEYAEFVAKTSYLPKPTPSALKRLGGGWVGAIVGIVVAVVLRIGHGHLFGS